jgi:membrane-bound ClpP family serine protease
MPFQVVGNRTIRNLDDSQTQRSGAALPPRLRQTFSLFRHSLAAIFLFAVAIGMPGVARAQDAAPEGGAEANVATKPRVGWKVDVPLPLNTEAVDRVLDQLAVVAGQPGERAADVARRDVVLHFLAKDSAGAKADAGDGSATQFEDALRLARALSNADFRSLRLVAYVDSTVRGHAVLPILACDLLLVGSSAMIGDAVFLERGNDGDETVIVSYRTIAARRGLFPAEVAEALVRPSVELVQATTLDGKRRFAFGDQLEELRRGGEGWREDVWSAAGEPLMLTADKMRDARIASQVVSSLDRARAALELAELKSVSEVMLSGTTVGTLLEINGVISADRVRRWELNLINSAEIDGINLWMVTIDSPGGNLNGSVQLAGTLSTVQPPIRRTVGYASGQTLGDAALIAVACRPLYLNPNSRLGGPGAVMVNREDLDVLDEAIERIAKDVSRPAALIRGLLDPTLEVRRYVNRRTGEVRYATQKDIDSDGDNPDQWQPGEAINLKNGLSAAEAIELGLAEGQAETLKEVATFVGLTEVPTPLAARGIVHFVEWFGSLTGVSVFLLLLGLLLLSVEVGAPGLSVPGFVSMICFALYFWMQFLNGTAEWLEVLAFALGIICIGIEIFIVPGVGIFGIGGLCLLVLGVVLTSQTFVIPRNAYQYEQLTQNLWLVLASIAAVMAGLAILKVFLPQTRFMRDLALEVPNDILLDRSERLADFEYLDGRIGEATTPLMPAGRVRFGDELVQVVTDGSPVAAGQSVKVIQVLGNRVVVAPLD